MRLAQRLDSVCDISMGQAPSGDAYNYERAGWPLIAGAGDFGDEFPAAKKYTTTAARLSMPGDIVLGIRASIGEKVIADGVYCLGRGVAGLRAKEDLDSRYLWHWLTHSAPVLASKAKGATFKQVNKEDIGELDIVLPSLAEQRRIAAILDRAEVLRVKRREALAELDSLAQSIFIEMFGDPISNPKGWILSSLGELCKLQGGLQVTTARKNLPIEVPYLRVANVYRGQLKLDEIKFIRVTSAERTRTILEKGDLLIVEGHGNPKEVGRSALWTGEIENCTHQNHLIRVRFDSSRILPIFACEYLNSPVGRRHLTGEGKTTSGLNTINASNVRGTPILVPPLTLQHEFKEKFDALETLKMSHRLALVEQDKLFASLHFRAFQGEL